MCCNLFIVYPIGNENNTNMGLSDARRKRNLKIEVSFPTAPYRLSKSPVLQSARNFFLFKKPNSW